MNSSSSSYAIFGGCRKRDADAGAKWRSSLNENIFASNVLLLFLLRYSHFHKQH